MALAWDLEVHVNGEGVFYVNREILCSFSGRLSKLLTNESSTSGTKPLKAFFHDLPGGAEAFELFTRFCYNNGRIQITPINICILHFIAHSMEVTGVDSSRSLIKQVEKSVDNIDYWSWPEILSSLKQCQKISALHDSSLILDRVLDSLVTRISTRSEASPLSSSPESSVFRSSFDTGSNTSAKNSHNRAWWFEDLVILNSEMMNNVVNKMISQKLEHVKISKFLFYYVKSKSNDEKGKVIEIVVNLLDSLNRSSLSCKALFDLLRVSMSQDMSNCCRERLEKMIGSQIDQASLDNLLISSPDRNDSLYDVNILLRFLRHFLISGGRTSLPRLKKVAGLLDLYMAEVAPDVFLKHSKFVKLVTALPDSARDSHDPLYRSIDMYLQVHNRLNEEEKMKICSAINYEKLCLESCKHLTQNWKFPSRTAVKALLFQQSKLKSLLHESNHFKSLNDDGRQSKEGDQIVLFAKKLDPMMGNEKLRTHLQGMQGRVLELEKACKKMQNQMTKMMRSKTTTSTSSRSLPRLCS
ncbi:BTB/POZ domain-containing protein [Platanthera guangdongensis]|uniref:BTB/POZ domain-containing protein n=1 Tax=Platanthera guangdongensis TaxID=2320717 RepID=A0ABR2MU21_9ASPA